MFIIYNLLFPLLFLLYLPYYLIHIYRRGGLTRDYWERFGFFSLEKKALLRGLHHPIWIHAVSVGETVAAISFVKSWLQRHPDDTIVFSCGTSTGFDTAAKKMPPQVIRIYCPIDFYCAVRRALNLIRPEMLLIFEVEIWPNLVLQATRRGVKVALINGRMSDRSSEGYARWQWIFRPIFQGFSSICLQTEEDADRIRRIIGKDPRIQSCGTMKFDQIPDCDSADKHQELDTCFGTGKRILFTAGSTHAGEEELICDAYRQLKMEHPELKLVLVPRHQERASAVENVLRERGLTWRLLRPRPEQPPAQGTVDVLLVNTTGELMNFYAASDITYVGKSLAGQTGGHNIIEPAIFGKAILYGSHMENFRAVAEIFRKHQAAVEIASDDLLLPALRELIEQPEKRQELGRKARQVVDQYRGSIARTLDILDQLRKPPSAPKCDGIMTSTDLPIYEISDEFRQRVRQQNRLLISAPTGSGKSTQVPQWLLDLVPGSKRILVLQPRRLAARMLAERVAWERQEKLGGCVGFQTRYENACGRDTRILFITEGILARMLVSSPDLPGIGAIVFDEFHERSLHVDLGLAMACHCQQMRRTDLRLIIMSATMDAASLQNYLGDSTHLHASGKLHPVTLSYRKRNAAANLFQNAAIALRELLSGGNVGDVLIFMPGGAEIRHCADAIRRLSCPELLEILPLYGDLPPDEQRKVMLPSSRRKIIIATNIAETSLTIPGVRHVIDSGLVRINRFDALRQVSILETVPIARDSAEQRAGRAGREAPGTCCRLWSELEQSAKPARSMPEIQRSDLADALLTVAAFGFPEPVKFPWFETPPEKNFQAGLTLLEQLGLLHKHGGGLTDLGEEIRRFPVHPRLALLLWHGQKEGCPRQAAFAAALLSERPLITGASSDRATSRKQRQERKGESADLPQSDFLACLDLLAEARQNGFSQEACQALGLHAGAARDISRAANDYLDMLSDKSLQDQQQSDLNFLKILLRIFPDRLARRLDRGTLLCELQGRKRAELVRTSLVRDEPLFLAGEIREVPASGTQAVKLELSLASGIREEWLWDCFPEEFKDDEEIFWDSAKQQVLRRRRLSCLDLTLDESVRNDADPDKAALLLAAQLDSNNMHLQGWDESVENWIARVRFLAEHFPEKKLPLYDSEDIAKFRLALCQGEYTYKAVRNKPCLPFVREILTPEQVQFVEQMAPTHLPLPKGRRLKIEYIPGQPPRGRARIQELFDFKEKPAVAKGQIPVLLDILAPNMRTVQITDDLPRFWEVHYPALRSALARRYPKHEWR